MTLDEIKKKLDELNADQKGKETPYFTVENLIKYCMPRLKGVYPRNVRKWCNHNNAPCFRIGRTIIWYPEDALRFFKWKREAGK